MAISSGVIWEIRTTGSYGNGGGFNPDRLGVDYSQQDSPQQTYSDIVIDGTFANKITSAAHPFASTDAGNILRIDTSTGFTPGWYEIVAVSGSSAAILDRNAGSTGSTAGSGRLGGAWGVLQNEVIQIPTSGNIIYVRGGTYPVTGTLTLIPGTVRNEVKLIGYSTIRGDEGKPIVSAVDSSVSPIINLAKNHTLLQNFTINGSGVAAIGVALSGMANLVDNVLVQDCSLRGFSYFAHFDRFGNSWLRRCAVVNCSGGVDEGAFWIRAEGGAAPIILFQCVSRDNYTNGFRINDYTNATMLYCLSIRNKTVSSSGGHGIVITNSPSGQYGGGPWISYATIYGNEGDGIELINIFSGYSAFPLIKNTIFEANSGYGIKSIGFNYFSQKHSDLALRYNAYFNNGLGTHSNILSGSTEIYLGGTAFVSPDNNNFQLNTSVGGNACHAAGEPGAFPRMPSTVGSADIGAAQTGPGVASETFPPPSNLTTSIS